MTNRLRLLAAIALCLMAQGCIAVAAVVASPVYLYYTIRTPPAPTLELKESPALLDRAHGSVVVADGSDRLIVVTLPGGKLESIPTRGDAVAASQIDEQGRVVYVRESVPWTLWVFGYGENSYSLILKSLVTGEERKLGDIRGQWNATSSMLVANASGLAVYSFAGDRLRIFDCETGVELDASWWDEHIKVEGTSNDGTRVIGWRLVPSAAEGPLNHMGRVSVDLRTHQFADLPELHPPALDLGGKPVSIAGSGQTTEGIQEHFPGCTGRWIFLDDRLAIYEGLAAAASRPRPWVGLAWPSFERSIRLCDVQTKENVTLVPRYRLGTFGFSRHLPPKNPLKADTHPASSRSNSIPGASGP